MIFFYTGLPEGREVMDRPSLWRLQRNSQGPDCGRKKHPLSLMIFFARLDASQGYALADLL